MKDTKYQHWNYLTSECFDRKMHCKGCFNFDVCHKYKPVMRNDYGILEIKFAVLKTFANIGAYRGYERDFDEC